MAAPLGVALGPWSTDMDESGKRVIAGRKAFYACEEPNMSNKNEIEVWRDTADARVQTDLADAQTRKMVAENALGIVEQQQQETHRDHQRKLELQHLANEHEIAKMGTVDLGAESTNNSEMLVARYNVTLALQKGWIKGLVYGTPIGWLIGLGSGLVIGFLF